MNFSFRKKERLILGLCALAAVIAAFALFLSHRKENIVAVPEEQVSTTTDPFYGIDIEAKAAYVVDLSDGKVLFAKDADEALPLASLTKLVSVIVATDSLPPQTTIPITAAALASDGDTGLLLGEDWTLDALAKFSLIASSNDGITAIAEVAGARLASSTDPDPMDAFVTTMNKTVASLGFGDMRFLNPTGLDQSKTVSGGYGSAKDVAGILWYILRNHADLVTETGEKVEKFKSDVAVHVAKNTDEALFYVPGIVMSKTGYTDLAGGNLAIVDDIGLMHPVALVVLGSSYDGRFTDMAALVSAASEDLGFYR